MPQISFPMEYYIQIINKDMLPIKAVFYVSCLNTEKNGPWMSIPGNVVQNPFLLSRYMI